MTPCSTSLNMPSPPTHTMLREEHKFIEPVSLFLAVAGVGVGVGVWVGVRVLEAACKIGLSDIWKQLLNPLPV